jgi:hypothetical protein
MSAWIRGSQLMAWFNITGSGLVQKCISHNLTPYNDQGKPIRPVDVVILNIEGMEQKLSRLDEAAWDLTGLEREKLIENQMQPLEELLQRFRLYLRSIESVNWDRFELPPENELAACFINRLVGSNYRAEDVDRLFKEHIEPAEKRKSPEVNPKRSRSIPSKERIKKCREIAKQIWNQQPDLTIAGMINRNEIIRQTKRPDGGKYSEMTVRSWIRDLCPNPKPGRRPEKRPLQQAC